MTTGYTIKKSKIHGKGVFTNKTFKKGETIGVGITFDWFLFPNVTEDFGIYINHSYKPNSKLKWDNNQWLVVASKKLPKNSEITLNYTKTPFYIKGPEPHFK